MRTADLTASLATLFSELADGAKGGGNAFILNSGDAGLLRSIDRLSAAEASASVNEGATIAAHARHLSYGLSLINRWTREGGNPFADAKWDDAWKTSRVDDTEWLRIRRELAAEAHAWCATLGEDRERAEGGHVRRCSCVSRREETGGIRARRTSVGLLPLTPAAVPG